MCVIFQNSRKAIIVLNVFLLCCFNLNSVNANCRMAVESVAFGTYNIVNKSDLDSTGTLLISCIDDISNNFQSPVLSIAIGLSTVSGSVRDRKMQILEGKDTLHYNLFTDAARTVVWGNTVGLNALTAQTSLSGGTQFRIPIFGRIPAGQDVSAGMYSDRVTLSIMP
jgi:spore coat protein U-like protein